MNDSVSNMAPLFRSRLTCLSITSLNTSTYWCPCMVALSVVPSFLFFSFVCIIYCFPSFRRRCCKLRPHFLCCLFRFLPLLPEKATSLDAIAVFPSSAAVKGRLTRLRVVFTRTSYSICVLVKIVHNFYP